jgi:hypothetical protein
MVYTSDIAEIVNTGMVKEEIAQNHSMENDHLENKSEVEGKASV